MITYLVFGDARREERRLVLTTTVSSQDLVIDGHVADVARAGQRLTAAVLNDPYMAETGDQAVVLLADEHAPPEHTVALLRQVGWTDYRGVLPVPERLPFTVDTTVLVGEDPPHVLVNRIWFTRPLVPTQRTVLHVAGTAPRVVCLSLDPVEGERPRALLWAPQGDPGRFASAGWTLLPDALVSDRWRDLIRVSRAIEAKVVYLLGASVVEQVDLHAPDLLRPADFTEVLPADVATETTYALADAGRQDLLPTPVDEDV